MSVPLVARCRDQTWSMTRAGLPATIVLADRNEIVPADLKGRTLLMQCRPQVRGMLDNWLGGVRDEIEIAGTYNLPLNAAIAVRHGLGVALCIDVGQVGEGLRFVPLSPCLDVPSFVAWRRGRTFSPSTAAFVAFLRGDDR